MTVSRYECAAQSYVFRNYTSIDGLAHNKIRDIALDSTGFIWLATWDGISRFDGLEFRNYFHSPGDNTTIPYFSASKLIVDRKNDLWVLVDNGQVCRYNRINDNFETIDTLGNEPLPRLTGITISPSGKLFFLIRTNVIVFDPSDESSIVYKVNNAPFSVFPVMDITTFRDDRLWGIGREVYEISLSDEDNQGHGIAKIESKFDLSSYSAKHRFYYDFSFHYQAFEDNRGEVWLASNTGLYRFDHDKKIYTDFFGDVSEIKVKEMNPVCFYRPTDGISIVYPGSDSIIRLGKDKCGLPLRIMAHKRNLFWFSGMTQEGTSTGLTKVVITPEEFTLLDPFRIEGEESCVYNISEDAEGALWIACRDKSFVTRVRHDGREEKINQMEEEERQKYAHPRSFVPDDKGMWIGYFFRNLSYYELSTGKITRHYPATTYFHTMLPDGNGNLVIASNIIAKYYPETGITDTLVKLTSDIAVYSACRESDSVYWFGVNYSRLMRYSAVTGSLKVFKIFEDGSDKHAYNVEGVCMGNDGYVWAALLGAGVCRYNTLTGEKSFFTTTNGLSNNTAYSILKDRKGNIWVSTNEGISVINPKNSHIKTFGHYEGLNIQEFNSDASYISKDGMIYFGGMGGVVRFDPEKLFMTGINTPSSSICLTNLTVSGEERYLSKPLTLADTLILREGEDDFHVTFTSLEYQNPEKIKYRYRLKGVSDKWSQTTYRDRNINYSNLHPGWYTLEIQSTDETGEWREGRNLAVRIRPFFYQSNLFIIGISLLIVTLLFIIILTRIKNFKQREEQALNTLRLQALRGQMNPHFIFNSLNSINYFISNNDKLSANRYIADFSRLIRSILDNLQNDYITLDKEIESVQEYLNIEHLRFGDKFDFKIEIDNKIDRNAILVSPGLIQPFIENAIWHGVRGLEKRKGQINIRFALSEEKINCYVEDDGIGRAKAESLRENGAKKTSRGISIARERLRIINSLALTKYNIQIENLYPGNPEPGTRVIIELPLK